MKSISTIAFTGLWMVCPNDMSAQGAQHKNELSVTVGGAAAYLNYDIPQAEVKQGAGANLGIEYTHYFSDNFGVSIGAEYQRFASTVKRNALSGGLQGSYNTIDFENEPFEFRYNIRQIEEEQKIDFINIPVMLVYQNNEYGFYIRGGAKIGLPVSGKFSGTYNLSTSGYYPQYNGELFDPEFMGFGTFNNVTAKGNDIDTEMSYIATVEFGIKQPVGNSNLYIGLYLDYGLNDIAKKNGHPVEYTVQDSGAGFEYNSILNSDYVDDIKTMAFGVKLRYAFLNF